MRPRALRQAAYAAMLAQATQHVQVQQAYGGQAPQQGVRAGTGPGGGTDPTRDHRKPQAREVKQGERLVTYVISPRNS